MDIPGYRIIRQISRGGLADVYLAEDESRSMQVAVKVVSAFLLALDPSLAERFACQGRQLARLRHPNIVQVYEVGAAAERVFLSMEYMPGGDLKSRMRKSLSVRETRGILVQLASGLEAVHREKLVHLDIKPANVLFDEYGRAALADFTLVRFGDTVSTRKRDSMVILGTPHYMSPEQASGNPLDDRSDIYSLGVMLYEMLTGNPPFDDENLLNIASKHLQDPFPKLPPHHALYQPLVDCMTSRNPAARFGDVRELLHYLKTLP